MACPGTAWVVTIYPDGTEVHAHPQHGADDVARAASLEYPDVGAMTLDHDPFHERLARALGLPHSPTLWAVGHDTPVDSKLASAEEDAVMAVQRFMQLARKAGLLDA